MENQEPLSPLQNAVPTKDPKNSKRQAVILMVGGLLLLAMAGGLTLYRYLTTPFINPDQESPATIQQGDTANWKTYRNEEYGFEFKYPQNLDLSEVVVGADSGSKYYYNYVSVTIDTPEDILILKNKTDDSGVSPNLFRLGAFNPINEESSPNCFITAKTITIDSIPVDVCKESAESMGGPNQMYLNFTKNGLTFSAQSGSYYNENIQLVDQILSTFKFISTSTSALSYEELVKSLPPDPGEAGKKTLEGIDSDNDGVRDDIQRYIVLNNPESEKLRAGLFQMAQALQRVIIESSNKTASITNMNAVIRSRVCLRYFVSWEASVANMDELLSEALNTKVRTQAFTEADIHNSGTTGSPVLDRATQRASCDFDPDSLPN